MKSLNLLFIFLCFSQTSYAQFMEKEENATFTQDELDEIDRMEEGKVIKRRSAQTGLFLKEYNTTSDRNKIGFSYQLNSDLTGLTDVQNIEALYAFNFGTYWVEFFGQNTTGLMKDLTSLDPGSDEGSIDGILESEDSITSFGASLSLRGQWLQGLVGSDSIFTSTSAGIGWYQYTQGLRERDFSGPGLKADFGLHKRASRSMHYGVKMSYQLASVKESASSDEGSSSSNGAHTLSWLTFGVDISFYF